MRHLITFLLFVTQLSVFAQDDKTVTLVVSGQGKTQDEAKQNALRSAIEQVFGTFISSKTEILNDTLISDEVISVSSGNIQNYNIVSQNELPNGRYSVLISAIVSVTKLIDFTESKGGYVEVKGGIYAQNIKQQILNEKSEIATISNTFGLLHEVLQNSFDFKIYVKEPQSIDGNSQNWKIPITVESKANKNIALVNLLLKETLENISLSSDQIEDYQNLGKKYYSIFFNNNSYFLRRKESMLILQNLFSNWFFYISNFNINNNLENIYISERYDLWGDYNQYYLYGVESKLANVPNYSKSLNKDLIRINPSVRKDWELITNPDLNKKNEKYHNYRNSLDKLNIKLIDFNSNKMACVLEFNDFKTLDELEILDEYKITSNGVISEFKYGGYVVKDSSNKSLILAPYWVVDTDYNNNFFVKDPQANYDYYTSQIFSLNQFNDQYKNEWKVPSLNDLYLIFDNLFKNGIGTVGIFNETSFFSNEENVKSVRGVYGLYIGLGRNFTNGKDIKQIQRASMSKLSNGIIRPIKYL